MAALPYMQLYVAEYLADTSHLNAAQHGAYLLLLMNYWQRGKPLRALNDRLANVARMSNDEWNANREVLSEFFEVTEDEWVHHRVERDLEVVRAKSEQARRAGKASGNARSTPVRTDAISPATTNASTPDEPLRTDTDTDKTKTPPKSDFKPIVERLFAYYCQKVGRNPRQYTLTKTRWEKCESRLKERTAHGDLESAEAEARRCIDNLVATPYNTENGYLDWTDQIFRSEDEFQKRLNGSGKPNGHGGLFAKPVPNAIEAIDARNAKALAQIEAENRNVQ